MFKRVIVTLLITLSITVASAQENPAKDSSKVSSERLLSMSFEDLMNVRVITPTLNLQKSNEAPATVMVVTMDQIRFRGYRNLAEVLNDLPGFMICDKSDPQYYNTASVRGIFGQDHFVILLDGVRISSPTNEPLPILENYPIYLARQIEVVFGPGSALYGADAMAGVVNIITKKASDDNFSITAVAGSQAYTNGNLLFTKKLENDFNITVGGQYCYDGQPDFSKIYRNEFDMSAHQTGIFNTSYGPMKPQGPIDAKYEAPTKSYNFYSSINKAGFTFRILHHYVEVPTSTALKPNNGVFNKDVFYGQGVTTTSANYAATIGKFQSTSSLIASFYKVNTHSNFRNLYGGMEHGYKYSTGSMVKAEQQISYTFSKKVNLTGGLTCELFQSVPKTPELSSPVSTKGSVSGILLNSTAPNNPRGIEAPFYSLLYSNIGSYVQIQYAPWTNLSFTGGVRFDKNTRFGQTINPRIGAVFNPFENTTIKALYGTAFWAPSPMVSFGTYGSFYSTDAGSTYRSDFWHLPNPRLKPMTSRSFELSIHQKITRKFSATLTAYKSIVDNMITDVSDNGYTNLYNNKFLGWDVSYISVPFNQGSQRNFGVDFMVTGLFDVGKVKVNAWSSISYLGGSVSVYESSVIREVEQPSIAPWQGRAGIDVKFRALQFSMRLIQTGKQRMVDFSNDDQGKRRTIAGYSLVNMSVSYNVGKKTSIFINGQNVLNQKYRSLVAWDASDPNAPSFNGSLQNPLRISTGVNVSF